MFEKYTEDARRVVVLAQEEARMLNHNYIGTEHLLLALIPDGGLAGKALAQAGVCRSEAVAHVTEIIGRGFSSHAGHIPFTPHGKEALSRPTGSLCKRATTTSGPSTCSWAS